MARSLKFRIQEVEGFYYLFSENKGADQLRGYREADLRLCFRICKKPVFSRRGSIELSPFTRRPVFEVTDLVRPAALNTCSCRRNHRTPYTHTAKTLQMNCAFTSYHVNCVCTLVHGIAKDSHFLKKKKNLRTGELGSAVKL